MDKYFTNNNDLTDSDSACEADIDKNDEGSEENGFPALLSILKALKSSSDDDDDDNSSDGDEEYADFDANNYHNRSITLSALGKKRQALEVCKRGLEKFPKNVDLLADIIKYSSEIGDPRAAGHYEFLKKTLPVKTWNWRAFTFSIDFLLSEDPVKNEQEIRNLILAYHGIFPYEEKAFIAESELEGALGNIERSKDILVTAVEKLSNAAQCALRLSDLLFDMGEFEEAKRVAEYGISASAAVQPSVNISHFYLIKTLAADAIIHRQKNVSADDIELLKTEYDMLGKFPSLLKHTNIMNVINTRITGLDFLSLRAE